MSNKNKSVERAEEIDCLKQLDEGMKIATSVLERMFAAAELIEKLENKKKKLNGVGADG